jgi:isocitrate/isopropylmalate dehydrogenase
VLDAIAGVLADGVRTPDLGGAATTGEVAEALVSRL